MAFDFGTNSLVTPEQISQFIWGVDDASTDAEIGLTEQQVKSVEMMMKGINSQIRKYVGSSLTRATYIEQWDSAGADELVPREFPIRAVNAVKVSPNGDFIGSGQSITLDRVTFDEVSIKFRYLSFPVGRGVIQVEYDAGYDEIPEDIALACLLQFQWMFTKMGKGDGMVGLASVSKGVGGGSETMSKDQTIRSTGLISEVVGMLDSYRRFEAPLSIMFTRVN